MLEYTGAGAGAQLTMLALHNDAQREYPSGPAQGLPETKVGTFSQALCGEAKIGNDQHEDRLEARFCLRRKRVDV